MDRRAWRPANRAVHDGHLIYDTVVLLWVKGVFSINDFGITGHPHGKRKSSTKINSSWTVALNVKGKAIKLL